MNHRKEKHEEIVKLCKFYQKGKCAFGIKCWFLHEKDDDVSMHSEESITSFNCDLCENHFTSKSDLMKGRHLPSEMPYVSITVCNHRRNDALAAHFQG